MHVEMAWPTGQLPKKAHIENNVRTRRTTHLMHPYLRTVVIRDNYQGCMQALQLYAVNSLRAEDTRKVGVSSTLHFLCSSNSLSAATNNER